VAGWIKLRPSRQQALLTSKAATSVGDGSARVGSALGWVVSTLCRGNNVLLDKCQGFVFRGGGCAGAKARQGFSLRVMAMPLAPFSSLEGSPSSPPHLVSRGMNKTSLYRSWVRSHWAWEICWSGTIAVPCPCNSGPRLHLQVQAFFLVL
jgi:hypothetical protein